jgi:hypothetical protein
MGRAEGGASSTDAVTESAPAIQGTPPRLANAGETPTAWIIGMNNTGAAANFVFYAVCASP